MLYRLFLYKTNAVTASAPAISIVNEAISTNSEHQWKGNYAADFLEYLDAKGIIKSINKQLTDSVNGQCKCRANICFPPKQYKQRAFIYVATSYAKVQEVLPKLSIIAEENDLVLYDAETKKTFYRNLVDKAFITLRLRHQALHKEILNKMKPVWKVQKISSTTDGQYKISDYVVTLRKDPDISFEDRVKNFYRCLSDAIADDEDLVCEDRCYKVVGECYQITYTLEGYKKHANRIGYKSQCADLLNRMSTCEAYKYMQNLSETEKDDILSRMNFTEMVNAYPNPADRFAASVNITKWQRKQVFDIRYSKIGYYGSEILFHIVPDEYSNDTENISVLKIEEESASFILPFIEDIYPYFYERYYLEENHLPAQMWDKILDRLKEAKKMILYDTFNPKLSPYIKHFNLFVLASSNEDNDKIRENKTQFLYEHRYEAAYLYDVFIKWSEAQLDTHCYLGDERMFNIQGP